MSLATYSSMPPTFDQPFLGGLSSPKLLLDDFYGQGYRVLAYRARMDLLSNGSNVSGGGLLTNLSREAFQPKLLLV